VSMFCGHASHWDEFCFRRKKIEKMCLDYARNSYHDEFIDFPPRSYSRVAPSSYSRASPHIFLVLCLVSLIDITITHMVLVHERTTLCLDVLDTAYILIMVIVSHVGMVFLLEGLTPILSPDTWTTHVFPIVVHAPLVQMMRCKRL
jgi:uncharacterized protein YjeT (DUF2065 family)